MKILISLLFAGIIGSSSLTAADNAAPAAPRTTAEAKGFKNVEVDEFDKLRANKETVVLDVRTSAEFQAGHLPGAVNIDWYATAEFDKKMAELDKSRTYLVHCASGGRSAKAGEKLAGLKFISVYNLLGGFNAWSKAGKPVEKPTSK